MPKAWFIHHHSISTSLSISIYLTVLFLKELHLSFCFLFCWYPSKMLDYISSMSSHLMIISKWEWKRKCANEGRISFEKEHTLLEVLKWIKWWDKKRNILNRWCHIRIRHWVFKYTEFELWKSSLKSSKRINKWRRIETH